MKTTQEKSVKTKTKQEKNTVQKFSLRVLGGENGSEARSSEQERRVDARALIAEEGRDKLR